MPITESDPHRRSFVAKNAALDGAADQAEAAFQYVPSCVLETEKPPCGPSEDRYVCGAARKHRSAAVVNQVVDLTSLLCPMVSRGLNLVKQIR
jgi:hypothetical protein